MRSTSRSSRAVGSSSGARRAGEELRTLDGVLRRLDERDLVIADAARAVALAGIMGGEETEVADDTSVVLLEAANFEPVGVSRSAERLHLRTEGLNRWEKGVDPYVAEQAARWATELMVALAGARWVGHTDVQAGLPERATIELRPGRAAAVAGHPIPPEEGRMRLERLGFDVDGDRVTVPTWRARDIRREIDVVEEVVRFELEDVPPTLPERTVMFGRLTHAQRLRRVVEEVLVGAGFSEAYTYSLQAEDPDPNALELPEPLSAFQRVLRTTLLYGLVGAAGHNVDVGNEDVALFEIAHVYLPSGRERPDEPLACRRDRELAATCGRRAPSSSSSRRSSSSRASSAPSIRSCGHRRRRRCRAAGSPSSIRGCSTASGARSSSTSRSCSQACPSASCTRT